MSLPSVTALCPTYGRTGLLEEAIGSFLRQDYEGEKHLVVVNDLAEQTLVWPDCPENIRIVNLDTRLPNLGAKKNLTALFAQSELIINWGDDDIHLPNRILSNVAAYAPGNYVMENRLAYIYKRARVETHTKGLCGPFLMARADYWRLGGIPDADVGEDLQFLAVVKRNLTVVQSAAPSYLYRWDTGRYHISGLRHESNPWEKAAAVVRETLANGTEPRGIVELRPQWREDYEALAQAVKPSES